MITRFNPIPRSRHHHHHHRNNVQSFGVSPFVQIGSSDVTPGRCLMKCQPCSSSASLSFFGGSTAGVGGRRLSSSSSSAINPRVSRVVRVEVEKALLDYLHCTRNMDYVDADHISKNSPNFAKFLLTKLDTPSPNLEDVCREIKKFLRYNPINEFDPFLESSGLRPSEIRLLLSTRSRSRGLCFFLSDGAGLLENYHVLCNYGVPRLKIGKIYKEASDVFELEHGVLKSKLKALEELGLETSTVTKLVSSCPNLLSSIDKEFSHVLAKLKELGFEQYWIRSSLSTKYKYRWGKMRPLLEFLCEMGCEEDELKTLIRENPWFLFDESGKKLYNVVAIFLKLGLKRNAILTLLLNHPQIVSCYSFVKNLPRWIEFLNMCPEEMATVLASQPCSSLVYLLNKKPEHVVAASIDIDAEKLRSMIIHDPTELGEFFFFCSKNTKKKRKIKPTMLPSIYRTKSIEKTDFLLKLGFPENSDEMVAAQTQFRGRGDRLEARFNVLLEAGLGFEDCSKIVKEAPRILNQSREILKTKIDYLVNLAGYPLDSLIDFPTYLCYDIQRIRVRLEMFRWMNQNGGVKAAHAALSSIIASSTHRYLKYYVNVIPKGFQVWENLQKSSSTIPTPTTFF